MIKRVINRLKRRNEVEPLRFTFPCPQDGCRCQVDLLITPRDMPADKVHYTLQCYANAAVEALAIHIRREHGKHVDDCPRRADANDYCICENLYHCA